MCVCVWGGGGGCVCVCVHVFMAVCGYPSVLAWVCSFMRVAG